jgi:hypothetical protein
VYREQSGQAAVEWTALMAVVLAMLAFAGVAGGGAWRLGEGILHAVACAAGNWCEHSDGLERAYGADTAALVRRFAPDVVYERGSAELPVDFRRCRRNDCSNGPDRPIAVDRSGAGLRTTAFTRVIDRRPSGGALYLQYWLYYPESFTGGIGRKLGPLANHWPGRHADDWEGYQVRIESGGGMSSRATAHGGYRGFKHSEGWGPWTGLYRVSGGSHAGHLITVAGDERRTGSAALDLVPLERMPDGDLYDFAVSPPWEKAVYRDPESGES